MSGSAVWLEIFHHRRGIRIKLAHPTSAWVDDDAWRSASNDNKIMY